MFKHSAILAAVLAAGFTTTTASAEDKLDKVRLGWCSQTLNATIAPIAIAQKMGWFKEKGIEVEVLSLNGSSDCARNVATGEVDAAFGAPEPVALLRSQGVDIKVFATGYRRNIFGLAVPEDSEIKTYADMKGKTIGVTTMSSVGVVIARAVLENAGLNAQSDVKIVVSGPPAQSAALIRSGQVDLLSHWGTNYLLVERSGVPLRRIEDASISAFPANSFVGMQKKIEKDGDKLAALARGYFMGTAFALKYPEKASDILYEMYPHIKPLSMSDEVSRQLNVDLIAEEGQVKTLEEGAVWGQSDPVIYDNYMKWLRQWELLKSDVSGEDILNVDLLEAINDFNEAEVLKAAEQG